MRFLRHITLCAAAAALCTSTTLADTLTDTSFTTDLEPASGYAPGQLSPDTVFPFVGNQPFAGVAAPRFEDKWLPGFNNLAIDVSTAQAHSGTQSIEFTGFGGGGTDVISQATHVGMIDGAAGAPLVWEEKFSMYVPDGLPDARVLRAEPFNNFPGQGFTYQLSFFLTAGGTFRPELQNAGGVFNDLRDELGKPDGFELNKWWNVSIVADGAARVVTAVSISDDFGSVFAASGLSEPFGLGNADRPERLSYFGNDGVFLDDISVVPEPAMVALLLLAGSALLRRRSC